MKKTFLLSFMLGISQITLLEASEPAESALTSISTDDSNGSFKSWDDQPLNFQKKRLQDPFESIFAGNEGKYTKEQISHDTVAGDAKTFKQNPTTTNDINEILKAWDQKDLNKPSGTPITLTPKEFDAKTFKFHNQSLEAHLNKIKYIDECLEGNKQKLIEYVQTHQKVIKTLNASIRNVDNDYQARQALREELRQMNVIDHTLPPENKEKINYIKFKKKEYDFIKTRERLIQTAKDQSRLIDSILEQKKQLTEEQVETDRYNIEQFKQKTNKYKPNINKTIALDQDQTDLLKTIKWLDTPTLDLIRSCVSLPKDYLHNPYN